MKEIGCACAEADVRLEDRVVVGGATVEGAAGLWQCDQRRSGCLSRNTGYTQMVTNLVALTKEYFASWQ